MNSAEQNQPRIVIVAYKPKPGQEEALLQLTREHVPILREQGLATGRPVTVCRAADGTILEVFEWAPGGIERAHHNPVVGALWTRYAAACDIMPLALLAEAANMFAGFAPVCLGEDN